MLHTGPLNTDNNTGFFFIFLHQYQEKFLNCVNILGNKLILIPLAANFKKNKTKKQPNPTCREKVWGVWSGPNGTNAAWGWWRCCTWLWSGSGFTHFPSSVTTKAEQNQICLCYHLFYHRWGFTRLCTRHGPLRPPRLASYLVAIKACEKLQSVEMNLVKYAILRRRLGAGSIFG